MMLLLKPLTWNVMMSLSYSVILECLASVAERLVGHVQRYSEKNGFGFIACPACRDQFGRDAQLFQEDWEALELHVGSAVSFVLSFEERFPCPKGRPWAAEIQKLEQ
ncbi:unnamed protein product [Durusdinium trenchii]|uniref:Uncharacterized protein n=1 Tax=Durusdinium trenchii TaxID=1381693 RepID=A0ABP0HKE7_9DINO